MKRILGALSGYGWLAALLVALLVGLAVVYTRPPSPTDLVTPDAPAIPDEALEDGRGPDLTRGRSVGATPSKAYPRPDSYFSDRGIKYNFYTIINWSARSSADSIDALVLHVTGAGTCPGMRSWFNNPAASASSHFGVCKDGSIEQYVEVGDVAWDAGYINRPDRSNPLIAFWQDKVINPNRRTVGIEVLLAPGEQLDDYPAMKQSLDLLVEWLLPTLGLPPWRDVMIGHNQIDSVNRSVDPVCCYSLDLLASRVWQFFNPPAPILALPTPPAPTVLTIEERLARIEKALGIVP